MGLESRDVLNQISVYKIIPQRESFASFDVQRESMKLTAYGPGRGMYQTSNDWHAYLGRSRLLHYGK